MLTPSLDTHDQEALRSLTLQQLHAMEQADWTRWIDACAEDVILHPVDEQPVEGRHAVVAWLESLPPVSAMSAAVEDVGGEANYAFTRGSAAATLTVDGAPIYRTFSWLKVFNRQDDGTWKVVTDLLTA